MKRTIVILLSLLSLPVFGSAGDLSLKRVVIDAGHGGKDPGAVSQDRKTYEKTLTLDLAKRLGEKITAGCPGVSVKYTRSTDAFVSLNDRAVFANRENADLFISIHINASRATSANGYSLHVLGQSSVRNRDLYAYNMDVCKRENSVILLEDNYTTTYQGFDPSDSESFIFMQLMQNSHLEQSLLLSQMISKNLSGGPIRADRGVWQNPFYVLWKTAMPAVLVELGFISNTADLSSLRDSDQRDRIAEALFKSFVEYKERYDSSVEVGGAAPEPAAPAAVKPAPAAPSVPPPSTPGTPEVTPVPTAPEAPAAAPVAPETPSVTPAPAPESLFPGMRPSAPSETRTEPAAPARPAVLYGAQIFALRSVLKEDDSRFLGYTPRIVKYGDINKYVIGVSDTIEAAKKELLIIRKTYPQAFIVELNNR